MTHASVKTYSVEDFQLPAPKEKVNLPVKSGSAALEPIEIAPLPLPDDLGEIIPSDLKWVEVIVTGDDPPGKFYLSRSERMIACVCWMLANGVQPGHVLSILLDPAYAIGAHVRENPSPLRYGQRQVVRALMMIDAKQEDWPVLNDKLQPAKDHASNIRYALARLGIEVHRNLFTFMNDVEGFNLDTRDLNDVADILSSRFLRDLDFRATSAAIKSDHRHRP